MLIFFLMCVLFMLHVQFLLSNIILGEAGAEFFQFEVWYDYSKEIAIETLYFTLSSMASLYLGYMAIYRKTGEIKLSKIERPQVRIEAIELHLMNFFGLVALGYMVVLLWIGDFDYSKMTQIREGAGFIFELRIIYLIVLSRILLNVDFRILAQESKYKFSRAVVLLYAIGALLFQARSVVFELFTIFAFSHLMWSGDKVRRGYIAILFFALVVPNIMVLGRIGVPDNFYYLIGNLFTFEYSVFANKFLSTAIYEGSGFSEGVSFISSLPLIVPSAVRDLFDISVNKSIYYSDFAVTSGIEGGGFSLLAEMYSNFGWGSLVVMGLLGVFIGHWNLKSSTVGRVNYFYSTAPLIYAAFVLALRNDFGVFLKYVVQLLVIAALFGGLFYVKHRKSLGAK